MTVNKYIDTLKNQALTNQIPIIQDEVAIYLFELIKHEHIQHVLEIGTASSYSAHIMASAGATVETIERNDAMKELARYNIEHSPLKDLITLFEEDAITFKTEKTYDLIFIDGAKSKYKHFFDTFQNNLNDYGYIICDNMFFHHLNPKDVGRNTRQLLKKLKDFQQFLLENKDFKTEILAIGDGLSISRRLK